MAFDVLAPCVAIASAAILITLYDATICKHHFLLATPLITSFIYLSIYYTMSDMRIYPFGSCKHHITHWGRVTHICVSKITIIGSASGLSPGRHQAIIWTSVAILLIEPLGTNFSEIVIEIYTFSFKKMHLKMSSRKLRPFCLGLNVLNSFRPIVWLIVAWLQRRQNTKVIMPRSVRVWTAFHKYHKIFTNKSTWTEQR